MPGPAPGGHTRGAGLPSFTSPKSKSRKTTRKNKRK